MLCEGGDEVCKSEDEVGKGKDEVCKAYYRCVDDFKRSPEGGGGFLRGY